MGFLRYSYVAEGKKEDAQKLAYAEYQKHLCNTKTGVEKNFPIKVNKIGANKFEFVGEISDLPFKIRSLRIKNLNHIKDLDMKFTFPKGHSREGQALDRVCFIGHNGTGKTTILKILSQFIAEAHCWGTLSLSSESGAVRLEVEDFQGEISFLHTRMIVDKSGRKSNQIHATKESMDKFYENQEEYGQDLSLLSIQDMVTLFRDNRSISAFCTEESSQGSINAANANYSLNQLNEINKSNNPLHNLIISNDSVQNFWANFVKKMQYRKRDFDIFAKKNKEKTYAQLEIEFNQLSPSFGAHLSTYWNLILKNIGLRIDEEGFSMPATLNEKIGTEIKYKDKAIPISYLSSGIRNYIFRIGHILSLYEEDTNGGRLLFVDEPELGLSPRFQDEIVKIYIDASNGSQVFFSTHSIQVASDFNYYEKFILDYDNQNETITFKLGSIDEGQFPEKTLYKEFGIVEGYQGLTKEEHARYLSLIIKLKSESDESKIETLATQIGELKLRFGF